MTKQDFVAVVTAATFINTKSGTRYQLVLNSLTNTGAVGPRLINKFSDNGNWLVNPVMFSNIAGALQSSPEVLAVIMPGWILRGSIETHVKGEKIPRPTDGGKTEFAQDGANLRSVSLELPAPVRQALLLKAINGPQQVTAPQPSYAPQPSWGAALPSHGGGFQRQAAPAYSNPFGGGVQQQVAAPADPIVLQDPDGEE